MVFFILILEITLWLKRFVLMAISLQDDSVWPQFSIWRYYFLTISSHRYIYLLSYFTVPEMTAPPLYSSASNKHFSHWVIRTTSGTRDLSVWNRTMRGTLLNIICSISSSTKVSPTQKSSKSLVWLCWNFGYLCLTVG